MQDIRYSTVSANITCLAIGFGTYPNNIGGRELRWGVHLESKESRKEQIRKFKERKTLRGVFAVRCSAPERTWVGATRNLDAERNGCWFALRHGSHADKSLQSVWNEVGEEQFQYEVLEALDDEVHPIALASLLKERKAYWAEKLSADSFPPGS